MKILENNYIDNVFPKTYVCSHCSSILELNREDCKVIDYNKYTEMHEYEFTCPCCNEIETFWEHN